MEWISGVKLTTLPPEEIRSLVKIGQVMHREPANSLSAVSSTYLGLRFT